jgi:hypothetical protein
MAAAPLSNRARSSCAFMVNTILPSRMPRGTIAGRAGLARSRAGERSGVSPQRRLGGAGLFDMSASQAFKAGVASHHVHAALRARRSDFKTGQCMLPCQAGTLLVPPSSVINRLEVVDNDCHQRRMARWIASLSIIALCCRSRRESRVK